ncbi:hypothetical protein LIQ52_00450 [Mitsuokella jalaludinii]|uniref:hypothetical protein n=1 Tax=Mitsuokella jalaludinii TaxID=187979 RepID=UPI001D028CB6|nr:hypothetical protein [Mitsuokella jalaludinii]MCB5723802.1 hypothetical protein [Mitsuokella jalaludinii]
MREAIRQALIDGVPEVEGRVFEPFAAGPETEKPYLIVRETAEEDNTEWAGFRGRVEVWPYVEQGSLKDVDDLSKEIALALNMQLLEGDDGDALTCIHDGSGEDIVDEEWDALTRCVYFYALALQPAGTPGPAENDPWIDALVSWTKEKLGDGYNVYGGKLPASYKRPAVLWRLDNTSIDDAGALAFVVSKQVACHIFGRNAIEEGNIAISIAEQMGAAVKIPLKPSERLYMTLQSINATLYTDALKQGHLRAILTRRVKRPREEVAKIAKVTTDGIITKG